VGTYGVTAVTADDIAGMAAQALNADRPTVIHHEIG
jgi:hypothetical protein